MSARDLHAFLEVGKDFSTWIKDRIQHFEFVERLDFEKSENLRSPISGSTKARAQVVIEYALSIDMAKVLSMVGRRRSGAFAQK